MRRTAALALALVLAARRVGVTEISMSFLSDNRSMRALSRDLGAVSGPLSSVIESVKTIPARDEPTPD